MASLPAEDASENTCGQCKHWYRQAADPNNLDGVARGTCREQLHLVPLPAGRGIQLTATYPSGIPHDFLTCGRFELRRLALVG